MPSYLSQWALHALNGGSEHRTLHLHRMSPPQKGCCMFLGYIEKTRALKIGRTLVQQSGRFGWVEQPQIL
eukprot:1161673-Amphidinium_carterae.2